MTEDEAMSELKSNDCSLQHLSKKFHTKEFAIKFMTKHNIWITGYELYKCGIKTDYDIALVKSILLLNSGAGWRYMKKTVLAKAFNQLTKDEIDKLWLTLELIK